VNPFDLRGPEFLIFYLIVSASVIVALILLRRTLESASPLKLDLADPYLVAYLRGGQEETLRVALVSLIDRGLLIADGTRISRADNVTPEAVRKPLDRALLQTFATPFPSLMIHRLKYIARNTRRHCNEMDCCPTIPLIGSASCSSSQLSCFWF
jgi:uncharacterized protein (TIGR04222 family)